MTHIRPLTLAASLGLLLGGCAEHEDTLSPSSATDQSPPQLSTSAQRRDVIPGQYIVVFRDHVQSAEAVAKTLANKHKGKLKRTYKAALKGMALELSDSAAAALRQDPAVEYVEQDQMVYTDADVTQPGATIGLDRIDQRFLPLSGSYTYSSDGSGVRVYIIDSGIHYGHSDFGGRALFGFDAFGLDGGDCNGHGTHVAGTVGGTVFGVAKKVQLYSVRVFVCEGSTPVSVIIDGVDWVTSNRVLPAVVNMSLRTPFSGSLNQAVANSIASGLTYVIAAGNDAIDACNVSPASVPNAITVGASWVDDAYASFSNYGSCLDIFAPGVNIRSTYIGSATAIATNSGTSMAAPHVAGAAALFLSTSTTSTPAQVTAVIKSNGTSGVLSSLPLGTVNLLLHSRFATSSAWTPRTSLPSARRGMAAWAANGLLYSMGGSNSSGTVLTTVQSYSPITNTWSNKAALPSARQTGNGAVTINNIIYLAGGHDAAGALTRTLYAYNTTMNTWSTRASMPAFSSCGGSAVIGGKVYVFSGCTRSSTGAQIATGLLHRYDPGTNVWTTLRAAPSAHFQPVVSAIAGKLYVIGGNNPSNVATGRVDMYDPATNSWSTRTSMPTARVGAAGTSINGKIYVFGGRNGTTYLNAVQAYDPLSNSWSTRPSMPTARAALGVAGISGFLYAVGGRNGSSVLATNERFTP